MRRRLSADSRRHLTQSSQILPLDTSTLTGQRHHPVLQVPITQPTKIGIDSRSLRLNNLIPTTVPAKFRTASRRLRLN